MARLPFRSICFGLLCLFLITCPASAAEPGRKTPIDRYVNKPDASYRWEIAKTIPGDGITTYVVDMVSQTWRTK